MFIAFPSRSTSRWYNSLSRVTGWCKPPPPCCSCARTMVKSQLLMLITIRSEAQVSLWYRWAPFALCLEHLLVSSSNRSVYRFGIAMFTVFLDLWGACSLDVLHVQALQCVFTSHHAAPCRFMSLQIPWNLPVFGANIQVRCVHVSGQTWSEIRLTHQLRLVYPSIYNGSFASKLWLIAGFLKHQEDSEGPNELPSSIGAVKKKTSFRCFFRPKCQNQQRWSWNGEIIYIKKWQNINKDQPTSNKNPPNPIYLQFNLLPFKQKKTWTTSPKPFQPFPTIMDLSHLSPPLPKSLLRTVLR